MKTSPLVRGYLDELRSHGSARLGPQRADELVDEINEHIESAIADGRSVEDVLDRLGSPAEIVAAEAPAYPTAAPTPVTPLPRLRAQELFAISLLLLGLVAVGIGWIVGVVLLWASDRWSVRDKLIGTLVWPGGLGLLLVVGGYSSSSETSIESCDGSGACTYDVVASSGPPPWVGLVIVAVLTIGPILTAIHLARSAKVPPR